MSLSALLVAAAVAAAPVEAQQSPPKGRGLLTAVGLGLMVGGAGLVGLGVGGVVQANEATRLLGVVPMPVTSEYGELYGPLTQRQTDGTGLAIGGFVSGGLVLVASVVFLVLDAPPPPVTVGFAPVAGGGNFVFTARF